MSRFNNFSSGTAAFLALGMAAGAVAPMVITAPATAATFSDIRTHWAAPFIQPLASENIFTGSPGGRFRPNEPVTRAQAIAMLRQAFDPNKVQLSQGFDIAAAESALTYHFQDSRYPNRRIAANDRLTRAQVLVAIAAGLGLQPSNSPEDTLSIYRDATRIPEQAVDAVAAATESGLVVNYPNATYLDPAKLATRADIAAFVYQAMVNEGVFNQISTSSPAYRYIVQSPNSSDYANNTGDNYPSSSNTISNRTAQYRIPRGTAIPVQYQANDRLIATPGETVNIRLNVARNIANSRGDVLIPQNSEIQGQLIPRYSGSQLLGAQFVAQRLIVGNRVYNNVNASSPLIKPQQPSTLSQNVLQDAAVTAAAQILLGRVTGQQINPGDLLGSVLTGRSTTNQQQSQVIVIDPETDLRLTFDSDFTVNDIADSRSYY